MLCQAVVRSTGHSSCKVSLFTFWNLSQVVILKLERFWKLILCSIIPCCLFFWIRKFSASPLVPNFCQTLNGSLEKFHISPLKCFRGHNFGARRLCFFMHFEVYLVFHNSLFIFFNSKILRSIRELFFIFFEIKNKISIFSQTV